MKTTGSPVIIVYPHEIKSVEAVSHYFSYYKLKRSVYVIGICCSLPVC